MRVARQGASPEDRAKEKGGGRHGDGISAGRERIGLAVAAGGTVCVAAGHSGGGAAGTGADRLARRLVAFPRRVFQPDAVGRLFRPSRDGGRDPGRTVRPALVARRADRGGRNGVCGRRRDRLCAVALQPAARLGAERHNDGSGYPAALCRRLAQRKADNSQNNGEYKGAKAVELQRRNYPDIAPVTLDLPPPAAFDRALAAAKRLGWAIVETDKEAGRIEASEKSRWFGFTDDVVVRVAPAAAGSRIDVRSSSRVGTGDFGVNAARVRRYLAAVRAGS